MTPVGPKTQRLSQIAVPAQHAAEYQDEFGAEIAAIPNTSLPRLFLISRKMVAPE